MTPHQIAMIKEDIPCNGLLSLKMSSLGLEGSKHIKHKGHIGIAEMTLNEFYITWL